MKCPKCEDGTLVAVRFKSDGRLAYVCEACEELWFDGEEIVLGTGHRLDSYKTGHEYELEDLSEGKAS